MFSDKIKIGVVTANYNNGKYFKEYLEGLLNQSHKPDYIIIVDDASTDDSWSTFINECTNKGKLISVEDLEYKFNIDNIQIVLFRQLKNSGPAAARNVALRYLLDKVNTICICDSDDVYYKDKIQKSIEVMQKYEHVILVYSDYDTYNEKSRTLNREFKEPFDFKRLTDECIVSNNSVIAVSGIENVGLYEEDIRGPEDFLMWQKLSEVGAVYHIPEALYKYRIHGNNITVTTKSEEFARQVIEVKRRTMLRRQNANKT